jgi:class 3 adenylate cyclase/tetratricopeptide (TPR) repeat protein
VVDTSPSVATPVGRTPAPVHPAAIVERRLVSVLFVDLVGFTTLAERRDAEDTRELLSHYFDLAREVIGRYGGTLEKFIGDAVMAVWGAPVAHEDDAERAVRAGLELVDAVRSLGPSIQARAGVLTGEAAVTLDAVGEGMVVGDLVNTASRLQSIAPPGAVFVGEATQRAASKAIVFEAAGEQTLKGKTSPVPTWRALRVVGQRGGVGRSETLEAPFVGRDEEFRLLKELFHATGREGRPRLVSVMGPAGIGKSRLAWEFHRYIEGLVQAAWWHDGRSPAYGDGITFWALGEMVRQRCALLEADDEATTRAKVAETLAAHVPEPEDRRWIEPALLVLLGVESGAGSELLFGAWRMFFERLAATAPVVMVFEDFHYADSGLLDFVDHLLEWSHSVPIYVVTLARSELLEKRPDWGAGKRHFTSLYLDPLTELAMRELLGGLVPDLPEPAVRAIVGRADGMPLYAVETLRMLLAEGRLAGQGGTYHSVGDLTTLAIPETLTALIASRLDGLAPDVRNLVSNAAVLGQTFTLGGLSAVSGLQSSDLEPKLRDLVRREILTRETDPRSPEHGQFVFVQALIREVAYGTLARVERKARHLAAAQFLETLDTDEIAGALAGHYLAARQNSADSAEADAVGAQALVALTGAAQRATALGSHDQALTFLDHALTVTTDPAEIAALLDRAGEAAEAAGRYEAAEAYLQRAIAAQRELADRPAIARATAALGRTLLWAVRSPEALALLQSAADEFADLATDPAGVELGSQLARAYYLHDDNLRAIEVSDRVLGAAEHADLPAIVADTLVTKGSALANLGRTIEGLGAIEAGRNLAEAQGLGWTVLRATNNASYAQAKGNPRAALDTARAGLALARRLGVRSALPRFIENVGACAVRTGDWQLALADLEAFLAEEMEPSSRVGPLAAASVFLALRGGSVADRLDELSRLVGDSDDPLLLYGPAQAAAFAAFAADDLSEARASWHRGASLAVLTLPTSLPRAARAALWAGDAAAARDDLATLDASGIHGPAVEADRRTIRAGLAALDGRPVDALPLYREALRAWRDLGLAWDDALCGLDMALLLDPADPEVLAAAEIAREILVRLEAAPFIARLEAALVRGSATASAGPTRSPTASPVT